MPVCALEVCLFAAAWTLARYHPRWARGLACFSAVLLIGFVLTILIATFWRAQPAVAQAHRWFGHYLVISAWLAAPPSIGVVLGDRRRMGGWYRVFATATVTAAVLVTIVTSMTGYLYPHDDPILHAETVTRFIVLHYVVAPAVLLSLLVLWVGALWPYRKDVTSA
jgi:hypothetical protein